LIELKVLMLENNQISDISVLGNLKNLRYLNIEENPIQDRQSIRELRKQIPNLQIRD